MLFVLLDFSPIKPDVGLIIWTTIIFILFWTFIGKYSFGPIARALKKREEDIQGALDEAKKAKEEMSNLKSENEKLLNQAREERSEILKEAKEMKNTIVAEARDKAKSEAQKIVSNAMLEIENQKKAALIEVKNKIGGIALDIAEKVIRKELGKEKNQDKFVQTLVDEVEF